MLLFDSLIAVGLPGDGNKQLLATITTNHHRPPSPQTLEAFNLLPRTSQNPFILLILLFHSPLALLFFTFKSLFHPNDIVIRTKQFSRIGSCGRMRRPLRVESRENLATFSYDLETWTLGITMSHIHSSCYSRLCEWDYRNDLQIIICETNFGGEDKYPWTVGEMVHLKRGNDQL